MYRPLVLFLIVFAFWSCHNDATPDYKTLPAIIDQGIHVVVEIPAGTNHKIEYQTDKSDFEVDQIDGKDRIINFLPYPGNYGFIPSTYMDPARGGDGDALDVLVLGESQPTGSVLKALPVGVLLLKDKGELDSKIIAVPMDSTQQTMNIREFSNFLIEYDAAKRIVEEWFLNYKGYGVMELIGWQDEKYAWNEIRKWETE